MSTTTPAPEAERAGTSAEPVLQVRDVRKYFPLTQGIVFKRTIGHVKAVDGVSFDLHKGETLGIVGESGCGKTTLGRTLLGLETPTDGSIKLKGREMVGLSPKELRRARRDIQIVLQDPYSSLDPRMTVADIVGEPFDIHSDALQGRSKQAAVQELLEVVGLNPDHINRYPHQFSGGQRQRIGIARALTLRPDVIVCDEPVSALDVSVQAQVVNLFERLQKEFGLAYVFIAHDLSVVRHISDRVMVMYLGKAVEIGGDSDIYEHSTHPYTQALLSAVPVPDPRKAGARDHIVLQGDVPSPADPPSGCRFRTRCWKAEDICATEEPLLQIRDSSGHPSACHFAAERDIRA
ncbi:dipeptide ABC transporter ATP-binding protein [Nocardioides rotundus]|uniref:ABC transporter ATP-binding protein n=1 Tax=Nocardioides rotundus TaxID=1774216 RepID=UPI001CBAB8DC|nr:dipeptide ABC transporter ATP-binding protein [Nocardioides rotundus]UAL28832.1 dipeptide ABC transporter ATP-binding protein [Nocardioides rotundus]